MAASSTGTKSLKEYLKKYENSSDVEKKKKKKKKAKKPDANRATGVLLVDQDPVWQKPVNLQEESDESAEEEKPQVDEDIEVKRMKRLEQLRLRRPYNAISEDGSGWISLDLVNADSNKQNSDMSPPRKPRARNDTPSPEPEAKLPASGRDDSDLSPPRQRRNRQDTPSPKFDSERVRSSGLNSDLSPPRKRRARNDSPSPEPEEKPKRVNADLSPPRQQRKRDMSSSQRARQSFPIEDGMHAGGLDLSPPRKKRNDVGGPENDITRASLAPDLSPPRKNRKEESSVSVPSKESRRTGLITGVDIRNEISKTKTDDLSRFQGMDPSTTGQGAEAVYRDKIKGGRISKDEYLKSKQKKEEKPKEIKLEWGKGLAQKREAEARLQELEIEKEKPFARTRDDPELDKMLKQRLRWGDPMAHLVKNKHYEPILPDLGDNEKMKESGFVIPQDVPSHSWLKRGLDAAPNRYGIKPGRHWDGVDRSTGYEQQMFKRTNEKQATEREAYLWSVSDM
ncbi:hypothetical protein LWI29_005459 [Acer saccharum]|uniref:BUD13 homolog n=1 Tax=Acer saccharum TaxID=4024 RepID=A0AA39SRI8_ACESA|nr:hypothetical protein LWI29_005459 [Acer saccharum]KAK1577401.1 hypothetical protein Q3G72_021496 [Acer saccharum]